MHADQFDILTKHFGILVTRRGTFRMLAAGVCGGLLARQSVAPSRAAQIDIADRPSADFLCTAQGLTNCGGVCVDVSADPYNCGACGSVCGAGATCSGGACGSGAVSDIDLNDTYVCAAQGLTDCGGFCTDTLSDSNNCGSCGNSCPLGGYCAGGACVGGDPCSGLTNCSGVCANVNYDSYHCGACGNVCPYPTVCCSGRCADLASDWSHCGRCEFGCYDGTVCLNGTCV
jgi:hypothetical protein